MSVEARLEIGVARNRRIASRRALRLGATSSGAGEQVVIHNISATGMLIQTAADLEILEMLEVELPEVGDTRAQVAWRSDDYFGCQFLKPIPKAAVSAAVLRGAARDADATESDGEKNEPQSVARGSEFTFGTKLRVIVGISIALWALILWAAGVI